jgi:plasmid stabilization system protein ParE
MSVRVAYSRRAAAEVEEITAYLDENSAISARQFLATLERAERQLSDFPSSGPPGARPGTRRLIVDRYIVSYRRRGGDVEIFAVRHASRRDARF